MTMRCLDSSQCRWPHCSPSTIPSLLGMCVSLWRTHEVQWLNLISEEFNDVITHTLQDLQWAVTRMRWRSARRCVTPMKEEMSWAFGCLRLEVWLCAPESLFAACSVDVIPEDSTKPETLWFNPFTSKTYYVRAWNYQPMPNQFEPDWSLYLAMTSH